MDKTTFSYDKIFFRNTDLFSPLESEQYDRLVDISSVGEADEGNLLYQPGDPREAFYLLNSGQVTLSTRTRGGKTWILRLLGPGELFGEMALDGETPRINLARIRTKARFYRFPREPFLDLLERNRGLHHRCVRLLTTRKDRDQSTMKRMLFGSSRDRVVHTLHRLFRRHAETKADADHPTIRFSQREVAAFSGLTRPETSRILNDLEEENYIALGYKTIELMNSLPVQLHGRDRRPAEVG